MRVYVPSTLQQLAKDLQSGQIAPGVAYAVTPALREAYASGDTEELEYVALLAAARASLALLAADPQASLRRVVLAADIPDEAASNPASNPAGAAGNMAEEHPAAIVFTAPLPTSLLVAGHIDDSQASQDVKTAVAALPAADAGDQDAEFDVDQAEGHELAWYATQELPHLVEAV